MSGFLTEINELNYAVLQPHETPASQALLEELENYLIFVISVDISGSNSTSNNKPFPFFGQNVP